MHRPLPFLVLAAVAAAAPPALAADPVVWRTDYNAARKEATERGIPLLVDIGSENCMYCQKLDLTTLRDPAVVALLKTDFVPLRVDAAREPALVAALKIKLYPTVVLAGADGKIHAFLEGYMDADRLHGQMARASVAAGTADWAARDFQEAARAIAAADYPRAATLLKGVVKDAGDKPVGVKARQVLAGIEGQAAGRVAAARDLDRRGKAVEAAESLAAVAREYAGTDAAADAATALAGLSDAPEVRERSRVRKARDLLAGAKEEFRGGRYDDCLRQCDRLTADYADLLEGREASALAAEVRGNPERLAAACEQMTERTAALYLTLADSWVKKGQPHEAAACLDRVISLAPRSAHAATAQTQLAALQMRQPAVTTGLRKPAP